MPPPMTTTSGLSLTCWSPIDRVVQRRPRCPASAGTGRGPTAAGGTGPGGAGIAARSSSRRRPPAQDLEEHRVRALAHHPEVVRAEHRLEQRREHAHQRVLGAHAPLVRDRRLGPLLLERPAPVPHQVADRVDLEPVRRVDRDDRELEVERVREPALDAVAEAAPEPVRAARIDEPVVEPGGRPPAPEAGRLVEDVGHLLDRGREPPAVDERVLVGREVLAPRGAARTCRTGRIFVARIRVTAARSLRRSG